MSKNRVYSLIKIKKIILSKNIVVTRKKLRSSSAGLNTWLFYSIYGIEQRIRRWFHRNISLMHAGRACSVMALIGVFMLSTVPGTAHAEGTDLKFGIAWAELAVINPVIKEIVQFNSVVDREVITTMLPKSPDREPNKVHDVVITFYSSTPDQTDSTPFITADGTYVRDGIVASNCFSFGTMVRFPDLYGTKVFQVRDRMNSRYGCDRVDIWLTTREEAKENGVAYTTMEVY